MKDYERTDLSPEERDALDRLPREVDPGPELEARTVAGLHAEGLLGGVPVGSATGSDGRAPSRSGDRAPRRSGGRAHPAWWAAGVAAALAVFFGGVALGQARSSAAAVDLVLALQTADAAERPSLVQQTGSLYVDAVASLGPVQARGDDETVGTGVEVGIATLYAAASELARLHPTDPRLREVLGALEAEPTEGGAGDGPTLHWF